MRIPYKAVGLFLCCLSLPVLAAAQGYVVTDLGQLSPSAINKQGQVAGTLNNHAYRWSRSRGLEDLGLLPDGTYSGATAINDLGTVAGFADGPAAGGYPGNVSHGAIWRPSGVIVDLGSDDCGMFLEPWREALDINGSGKVVGYTECQDADFGFLWTQGGGLSIVLPNWGSHAFAINSHNQVVGWEGAYRSTETGRAVFEEQGVVTELGTLGGEFSGSFDINDGGQVVGFSDVNGGSSEAHAFLWTKASGMEDLEILPGDTDCAAYGINGIGQVIGVSGTRAFIWTRQRGMRDLNRLIPARSGWVLTSATGINMRGQIVGEGLKNGKSHGFLLTPR
jgi:probable HAF family extracellular repeat protein